MSHVTAADISAMPLGERISLVEAIWDSIAASPESVGVPEWHKRELQKRLQAYQADPQAGASWDEVRQRLTKP